MPRTLCPNPARLHDEFETARFMLNEKDPQLVDRVMKGLFIPRGDAYDFLAREFLRAWSRYKPYYTQTH